MLSFFGMGFIECPERKPWGGAAIPFLGARMRFPAPRKRFIGPVE
jgi:hypothetical protein